MTIKVRFFASLREAVGVAELDLVIANGANKASVLDTLEDILGPESYSQLSSDEISIALNQEIQMDDFLVRSGDEVAFMPPITGG